MSRWEKIMPSSSTSNNAEIKIKSNGDFNPLKISATGAKGKNRFEIQSLNDKRIPARKKKQILFLVSFKRNSNDAILSINQSWLFRAFISQLFQDINLPLFFAPMELYAKISSLN